MFYFFLCVFTFTLFYLMRLINAMIFHGAGFTGDMLFVIVCLIFCAFIVSGTLRIKHLNNEFLRKLGLGIAGLGVVLFAAFCLSFKLANVVAGFELMILFAVFGLLEALYQIMPEGEPDSEEDDSEFEDITAGYFEMPEEAFYMEPEPLPMESGVVESVGTVMQIQEFLEEGSVPAQKLDKMLGLLNQVVEFGYEVRPELAEGINHILTVYLGHVSGEREANAETVELVEESFDKINQSLENIYYGTKGGMAYRIERQVQAVSDQLAGVE